MSSSKMGLSTPAISIGQRFHRLVVVEIFQTWNRTHYRCSCDCGGEIIAIRCHLNKGAVKSCGCYKREFIGSQRDGKHNRIHGASQTGTFRSWCSMLQRCTYEKSISYPRYGGRGIKICERWLTFQNFLDDMGVRPDGLFLERIDNDGNYEPSNCKWATRKEQCRNRRNNRNITAFGRTQSIAAWTEEFGFRPSVLLRRINRGMDPETALTKK